jgi:hypothetical protein
LFLLQNYLLLHLHLLLLDMVLLHKLKKMNKYENLLLHLLNLMHQQVNQLFLHLLHHQLQLPKQLI